MTNPGTLALAHKIIKYGGMPPSDGVTELAKAVVELSEWKPYPTKKPTILHREIGCSVPLLFSTTDTTGRYIRLGHYADHDLRNGFVESGIPERLWIDEVDRFFEYPFPPCAALNKKDSSHE